MRTRGAVYLFVGLAVLHTWPIARAPWREALTHNSDAQLGAWTMSWIARTLPVHPRRLFDGNIFAPQPRTLTYTDPMLVPALLTMPIRWSGGSSVLAFNLVMLIGLVLTAWSTWRLAARWTGSPAAALVAGTLAAFNVHLLTRLPHIVAAHMWGVVLAIDFTERLIDLPRPRDAVWLTLALTAVAVTSPYTLALAGVGVAVALLMALALRRWRSLLAIAGAALGAMALAAPILWPYVQFAAEGASRPLEMVEQFSATLAGYLTATSHLHRGWTAVLYRDDVNAWFAGFGALALAALGVIVSAGHAGARRRMIGLVLIAVIGIFLSFGPATTIYRWLYDWVGPLRGLRAAARFGFLYLLALALLSAMGLAWIERRTRSRVLRVALIVAALIVVTAEAWQSPIKTVTFDGVPHVYQELAKTTEPVMLVETPFFPAHMIFENGEYVLNATGHWRPVMNGYSGYTPMSYRDRAPAFWLFPSEKAIAAMIAEGATHIMVHLLERFGAEASDVERALVGHPALQLVASDARGHRLYRVRR